MKVGVSVSVKVWVAVAVDVEVQVSLGYPQGVSVTVDVDVKVAVLGGRGAFGVEGPLPGGQPWIKSAVNPRSMMTGLDSLFTRIVFI